MGEEEEDAIEMALGNAFEKREVVWKERLNALQKTGLSVKCLESAVEALDGFVWQRGRVDDLDERNILQSILVKDQYEDDVGCDGRSKDGV